MAITLTEWAGLIEKEYLGDFIAAGGAAVKLAVASDVDGVSLSLATIGGIAIRLGYLVAWVDAAATKVQTIDQIFFAVARQVEWEVVTDRWLRDRFAENGYNVPPDQTLAGNLEAIAEANDTTRQQLLAETRRWLTTGLIRDTGLAREFRTAMTMLCQAHLNPQNVTPSDGSVVQAGGAQHGAGGGAVGAALDHVTAHCGFRRDVERERSLRAGGGKNRTHPCVLWGKR